MPYRQPGPHGRINRLPLWVHRNWRTAVLWAALGLTFFLIWFFLAPHDARWW